jgi:hypothetical protein
MKNKLYKSVFDSSLKSRLKVKRGRLVYELKLNVETKKIEGYVHVIDGDKKRVFEVNQEAGKTTFMGVKNIIQTKELKTLIFTKVSSIDNVFSVVSYGINHDGNKERIKVI